MLSKLFGLKGLFLSSLLLLSACGGGSGGSSNPDQASAQTFEVNASAGAGGSISPDIRMVASGVSTTFTVTADSGFSIDAVTGCNGTLLGNTFTTEVITADCSINSTFIDNSAPPPETFTVTTTSGVGGSISPATSIVDNGNTALFTLTPDAGFNIDAVTGCNGTLLGSTYTTAVITADCSINATFIDNSTPLPETFTVTATAGAGGMITPVTSVVSNGDTAVFTVTPDSGFNIDSVSGCTGNLSGNNFITDAITATCVVTASFSAVSSFPPAIASSLTLEITQTKIFRFTWSDADDASFYRLLENVDGNSGFVQVSPDIPSGVGIFDHIIPLYLRANAQYVLQSCNENACSDSSIVSVVGNLVEAIGYIKTDNPGRSEFFGSSLDISESGERMVIAAPGTGNINSSNLGNAFVFDRSDSGMWSQSIDLTELLAVGEAGGVNSVTISQDGNTIALTNAGYRDEISNRVLGAVHIFTFSGLEWELQSTVIPDNASEVGSLSGRLFGRSIKLSSNGNILAVGDPIDPSNSRGINGEANNNLSAASGAVFIFERVNGSWSQRDYIKSSNSDLGDGFGESLSLSGDGTTLAVGAPGEDSATRGINGNQSNFSSNTNSGAVYIFRRISNQWQQSAYVKASNTTERSGVSFGSALSLASDGETLAVSAIFEPSDAIGVNGDQFNNNSPASGAVYVYSHSNNNWNQEAYVKATNSKVNYQFGRSLSLSGDGNLLAVGSVVDKSISVGINGDQENIGDGGGAVYVYERVNSAWDSKSYVKPSNIGGILFSGNNKGVEFSDDGNTLLIGAPWEYGTSSGINGDSTLPIPGIPNSGAVFLY